MSDAIKVGDRVRGIRSGYDWVVMGIDGDMAWLKSDDGEYTERLCKVLARIEPEPVALTPKYPVGERVQTEPLRLIATADNIYVVKAPAVGYELESGGWLPESLLFPVPEPCPTCKGSGVASE